MAAALALAAGPVLADLARTAAHGGRADTDDRSSARRRRADRAALGCGVALALPTGVAVARWGWTPGTFVYLVVFAVLVVAGAVDVACSRLPDRITRPAAAVGLAATGSAMAWTGYRGAALGAWTAALLTFGALGIAHLAFPAGLGRGDVKLSVTLGLAVGWAGGGPGAAVTASLAAMIAAGAIGTAVGLVLLVRRRRNEPYPFGPALIAGTVLVVLTGPAPLPT